MKRIIILAFLIFLFHTLLVSQWEVLNPKPDCFDLRDIKFINSSIGYAVGNQGKILKTTNGGESWFVQISNTQHDLKSVSFINADTGWCVGNISGGYDILLKTIDGGNTWVVNHLGWQQYIFYSIHFINKNNGWMFGRGDKIWKTTNGGETWTAKPAGLTWADEPTCIYFKNTNIGWGTCISGKFISTTNGGSTWTINSIDSVTFLKSIFFLNSNIGWMCGSHILKTTDGGISWFRISSKVDINGIFFSSASIGLGCKSNGRFAKTTDGGNSWTEISLNTMIDYQNFLSIAGTSANDIHMAGSAGIILKSTNAGLSWTDKFNNIYFMLRSVTFANLNTGWATGKSSMIYKTTDGGTSWKDVTTIYSGTNIYIYSFNQNIVWTCGVYGNIIKTTNGGTSWTKQTVPTSENLNHLFVIDENNIWAVGNNGTVIKTTNGGTVWTNIVTPFTSHAFNAICFTGKDTGYIGGSGGLLIKTTDGGASWNTLTPDGLGTNGVQSVNFINKNTGFVVGINSISKTTNGGITWSGKSSNFSLGRAAFPDSANGFIIANPWWVLKTTDGGNNWSPQNPRAGYSWIYGICALDKNKAFVVGQNGFISRTLNGGAPVVNLSLWIADNLNIIKIGEKIIYEGEKYILPAKRLDPPISKYQTIYNGIDSSVFYIEGGALTKSITLRIIINIPGGDSLYGLIGGKKVWFYGVFEVDGATDGFSFYEPYGAVLKIPKHADFVKMTNLIGFTPGANWYFGYYNNAEQRWDSVGITTQNNTDTVIAKITHFSEIGAGDGSLITGTENNKNVIVPERFSLSQNYPNPFNPNTKIKYEIPQLSTGGGYAELKLYDILGRVVATLVNEQQSAGRYSVELNAGKYSSGIYFYELTVRNGLDSFRAIKKMMLIK